MKIPDSLFVILVCLAVSSLCAGCGASNPDSSRASAAANAWQDPPHFTVCLAQHLETYPLFTAQDVYKFVHQSVAGPGHIMPGKEEAMAYLQHEIANLPDVPQREPLYEELGGERDLVRLHLRPYVKTGGDPESLVAAMQITSAAIAMDTEEMTRRLMLAASLLAKRGQHKQRDALVNLLEENAGQGYPALHHSESFAAAYHPAYRVIARAQAHALIGSIDR